jgi:DNA mismatch repair protein MutS
MTITPMMQQYHAAKEACGDALLFFRMGDFYELFYEDAKIAGRELGLTVTSRDKSENPIPMSGFPYHQLDSYLAKLIARGFKAAVCEQVEDPKKAQGLVKREVTRVVTPGTLTDDALLDPRESNYLACIALPAKKRSNKVNDPTSHWIGLAWAELSTGRFFSMRLPPDEIANQLARISPSECLVSEDEDPVPEYLKEKILITKRPAWAFGLEAGKKVLTKHFGTKSLDGFGFLDDDAVAIQAAGAIMDYLSETQRSSLDHIDRLLPYRSGESLEIDESTRRSLELTRTIRDGRRDGSLLAVLDRTVTSMGARLLGFWMANPLTDRTEINSRLDAVEELVNYTALRRELREQLRGVYDVERLLARVTTGRASPRDLCFVGKTLAQLPNVKTRLVDRKASLLLRIEKQIDPCPDLQKQLGDALLDECPMLLRDGGFIREGFNQELDRLRKLAVGGKQWIAQYQAEESKKSSIPNLKVGYNKVFGYYIEISNGHKDKVPENYIRKQTLKNAERYITPELKEYEEQVVSADEKAKELEYDLFIQLRDLVHREARRLQNSAIALAELDVLLSLAELAKDRNYCRAEIVDEPVLKILDGRHPVLDIIEPEGTFVPNDTECSPDEGMIMLITGPNMAGKSTYIRQVALLTIMAQMGSFIPAKSATIGVTDRVFARVGASDELSRGQSTFMVEMTETARILNTATKRSLLILDEIGRGTSTYDGVSLAWSIIEHVHDQIGSRTFFATHYHELTDLEAQLSCVRNLNVAVKEWEDNVVFLHKIVPGSADKSYGIHVARLAGVPTEVNERAKQILAQLENEHLDETGRAKISTPTSSKTRPRTDIQLTLFAPQEHPLLDEIRQLDVNAMTPLDALQTIQQWQAALSNGKQPQLKPR